MSQKPTPADLRAMQDVLDRYKGEIAIDKNALDDEIAKQAVKFWTVSEAVADCISYTAAAKDNFDQIEAALGDAVRVDHEARFPEGKAPRITDTAVAQTVRLDERWQEAKALRRQWEDMLQRMTFLKDSFAQRSSNMKELPTLYAAGYWQTSSADGRTRQQREADRTREELDRRREEAQTRRRPRD